MKPSTAGYTKVPNDVLEQLAAAELTPLQFKVLLAVVRASLGWNREHCDRLTLRGLARAVGRPWGNHFVNAVHALEEAGYLSLGARDAGGRAKGPITFRGIPRARAPSVEPEAEEPLSADEIRRILEPMKRNLTGAAPRASGGAPHRASSGAGGRTTPGAVRNGHWRGRVLHAGAARRTQQRTDRERDTGGIDDDEEQDVVVRAVAIVRAGFGEGVEEIA